MAALSFAYCQFSCSPALRPFIFGYGLFRSETPAARTSPRRPTKSCGVAIVAVCPGFMRTERLMMQVEKLTEKQKRAFRFDLSETTEYVGRAVASLAADPKPLPLDREDTPRRRLGRRVRLHRHGRPAD